MGQGDPGYPGDLSKILHLKHKEYYAQLNFQEKLY